MSHWRKHKPTASRFNALLVGWSIILSVMFGALVAFSLHGRV
jgi:hypothetical protein